MDIALCGKMTICSVESSFFCVTTSEGRTLEDTGTDAPSLSFKQELLALPLKPSLRGKVL